MLKTERMNIQEAVVCTALVSSFKTDTFDINSIKSAIEDYEKSRLGDYDTEFMLILNKDAVTKMLTSVEFIASHQAATRMDAIRNNYMGSIELDIECRGDRQLLECSLYYNFEKEDCELRAKVNNINGVDIEELRRQACEDVQLRKVLDILVEKGIPVPNIFPGSEVETFRNN